MTCLVLLKKIREWVQSSSVFRQACNSLLMEEWMIGSWSNASVSSSGKMLTKNDGADIMKLSVLSVARKPKWRWCSFLYRKCTSEFSEQDWTVNQYCHLEIMRVPKDINQAPEIWLDAWILYYNALLMTCSLYRVFSQKISSEIGTSTTFTRL